MLGNSGKIFVVISLQGVADEIRDAVDQGAFDAAKDLAYRCRSLCDKIQSMIQERGGHIHLFLYERQVLEVPPSMAEDMPMILEGYTKNLKGMVSCGMGLSFREAVAAMHISAATGEIEMYDPEDEKFEDVSQFVSKADGPGTHSSPKETPMQLPVNLFDATVPKPEPKEDDEGFVSRPGFKQEAQMHMAMVQAMAQVLQGGSQQQQAQQQAASQQPRDLREALEGKQVEGYQPASDKPQAKEPPKQEELKAEEPAAESEEDDSHAKLDSLLSKIKTDLPQIMALHDKNPEAYKAAMALVQKLLIAAKQGRVKKAEEFTAELEKAIRLRLPVGARKGNKIKVRVDGKERWRQMGAGQVLDSKGQPVSVRSSNKDATKGG